MSHPHSALLTTCRYEKWLAAVGFMNQDLEVSHGELQHVLFQPTPALVPPFQASVLDHAGRSRRKPFQAGLLLWVPSQFPRNLLHQGGGILQGWKNKGENSV